MLGTLRSKALQEKNDGAVNTKKKEKKIDLSRKTSLETIIIIAERN